jgi:hypothetical protein
MQRCLFLDLVGVQLQLTWAGQQQGKAGVQTALRNINVKPAERRLLQAIESPSSELRPWQLAIHEKPRRASAGDEPLHHYGARGCRSCGGWLNDVLGCQLGIIKARGWGFF